MKRDERVTDFLAPVRIIATEKCSGGDGLLKECSGQATTAPRPECVLEPGGWIVLDFGNEFYGGVEVTIGGYEPDKRRLLLTFGESVMETFSHPDHLHSIQETELRLTPWSVLTFGKLGFRFVKLENPESFAIGIQGLRCYWIHREFPVQGSFRCSDPQLNKIWEASCRTLTLCMQDLMWDGAKRDQLVWMGDLYPEIFSCAAIYGRMEIVERSLDFLRDETPLPRMMNGCGTYSFWWILAHHFWYRRFGALDYLREQHEYLKNLLIHLSGMVADDGDFTLKGGYQLLDWATGISTEAGPSIRDGSHAILRLAFLAGAELCRELGDESTATVSELAAEKLLRKKLALSERSTASNAFQAFAGFQDHKEVYDNCFSGKLPRGLSTFLGCFVLDSCVLAGHRKEALEYMRQYWGGMLSVGSTTFWEHFDIDWLKDSCRIDEIIPKGKYDIHGENGEGCFTGYRNSFCHGWGSMPAEWLIRQICGLEFSDSKTVRFSPDLCGLEWAEAHVPTEYGMIDIFVSPEKTEIKLPEGICQE